MQLLTVGIFLIVALLVFATFAPMLPTTAWWVRALDIPRVQVAAALLLALPLLWLLNDPLRQVAFVALAASLVYQAVKILPYTPLVGHEVGFAAPDDRQDVRFLAANVLKENESHDAVRALIGEVSPDVLFLVETDAVWTEALEPVLTHCPTVVRVPKDNHYGMVFATRLKAKRAEAVYLTPDDTPALFAELEDPTGRHFRFVGLHPRPPVPGEDTDERDAQILYAARFAQNSDLPVVVLGDFNEAAWSKMARRFKHVGEYVDPRIGRGLYTSFDATHPVLRAPIDQLYVTSDVAVVSFARGPKIGSDHFPILARLRFDADLAKTLNNPRDPLPDVEIRVIEDTVVQYRARLQEARDGA